MTTLSFNKSTMNSILFTSFGPSLNLVSGGDLANKSLVNFTRSSVKQYFDSDGVLQEASSNSLPTSYDPATGERLGWLIEESRTNEVLDSRDLTTGNWVGSATATRDQIGIDGKNNTACLVEDNSSSSFQARRQDITIPNDSSEHCCTVYIGKDNDETRFPEIQVELTGGNYISTAVHINTKTGNIVERFNPDNNTFSITDKGDFWEVQVNAVNDNSGNTVLKLYVWPAKTTTIGSEEVAATGSVIVDQAQVELNTRFPTSPIITGGSTVTRSAEPADITDVSSLNANQGTIYVSFRTTESSGILLDIHSDANNRMYIERNSSNEIHFIVVDGGVTQADLNLGTVADNTDAQVAVRYKENDIAGSLDGGTVQTDTSATIPSFTTVDIGSDYNNANFFNAYEDKLSIYKVGVSNSQLQSLTS